MRSLYGRRRIIRHWHAIVIEIISPRRLRWRILLRLSITVEFLQPFRFAINLLLFFACTAFLFFKHTFHALCFCRFGFFAVTFFGFELFAEAGRFGIEFPLGAGVGWWGAGGGLGGDGGVGEGGLVLAARGEGDVGVGGRAVRVTAAAALAAGRFGYVEGFEHGGVVNFADDDCAE